MAADASLPSGEINDVTRLVGPGTSDARQRTCHKALLPTLLVVGLLSSAVLVRSKAAPSKSRSLGLLQGESLQAWERVNRVLQDHGIDTNDEVSPYTLEFSDKGLSTTQCVVDITQAAAYLGTGLTWIDRSLHYDGNTCEKPHTTGCAISVELIVASFVWVSSYLSLAASSCADTVNAAAACAADVTGVAGNLGDIAAASTAATVDCVFEKGSKIPRPLTLGRRLRQRPVANVLDAVKFLKTKRVEAEQAAYERRSDDALCSFDVVQAASYIVRVIKQILHAVDDGCNEPEACSVKVLNMISSFGWISQFVALIVGDCSRQVEQKAFCTAAISDIIAATASGAAIATSLDIDCADAEDAAADTDS